MKQESEKFRLTCVAANILNWYREHVADTEQAIAEGEYNYKYPHYDRETLKKEWRFWTGHLPNENDQAEMEVSDRLVKLFEVLNQLKEN